MLVGISEDFTWNGTLDTDLTSIPSSGLYLNSGVHPSITVENLLHFLPNINFTFSPWKNDVDYGVFNETRNRKDIVFYEGEIYQSTKPSTNQTPSNQSEYWLSTNIESLRIKTFLNTVKDKVYSELSLEKILVNNQFLYENADQEITLQGNYSGWVIEPKGSDYVSFRINQISLQKEGTDSVDLYILNQNKLIKTIQVIPDDGRLSFQDVDITLSGKGDFKLLIDSTTVFSEGYSVDPLKFDGFVAYTTIGTGTDKETANYTYGTSGNGIGLNITAYLDPKVYINNNMSEFGSFIRSTFEYMVFEMFLYNSNNRSNRSEKNRLDSDMLLGELKDTKANTVCRKFYEEKKRAIRLLDKTFDNQLNKNKKRGITVKLGSY